MNKNLSLSVIISSTLWATFCKGPMQPPQGGPVPVNLYEVKEEEPVYYDMYPGNVVALNVVRLNSEVSGFLTDISFEEGKAVHKGQKLYEIERSKYSASYAQAEANLQIAKTNLKKASDDAERYNTLGEKGMAPKQRIEYAQVDVDNAKAQVASAEAEVLRAGTDLKHATIIAPFDGTIGISQVKLGAYVNAGQTLLNTISSTDPMAVDFVISEKEITRFLQFQGQKLSKADSLFTIQLPDKSIYAYPGSISFLDRAVDPQTGTLKVRLLFPNPKKELRDGMSCNIRVLNRNNKKLPMVPYNAVVEQMGEFFVYVVDKDTARQHKVTLGPAVGSSVVIFSGLTPGEQVVVAGVQKLKDGAAVQTAPPAEAKASTK